nr:replication protein A 70 kDa DNA-binding subunit A-like [Ipomoea batatas]
MHYQARNKYFKHYQGTVLHAIVPNDLVAKFSGMFKVGVVYSIRNFLVITNFYTYKTSPHEFMLKFYYKTILNQLKGTVFSRHMFRLQSIHSLKQKLDINEKELIAGDIKLCSSYDVTQLFINEDLPEILEFRESFKDGQTPMRSIVSMSSMSYGSAIDDFSSGQINVQTISEIYQNREYGDFWVAAKIVGIQSSWDWFHGCNKKLVKKQNGQYDCDKCKKSWKEGVLRYMVKVRVVD